MTQSRSLTHDEKKASEAAFQGLPFNPKWSDSARAVYEGILRALGKENTAGGFVSAESVPPAAPVIPETQAEGRDDPAEENEVDESVSLAMINMAAGSLPLQSRKDAITAGILKDATPAAKRVGLEFPVGLTNALWDRYVAVSNDMSEDQLQSRLQDIMVGVRLRLASLRVGIPLVDVPFLSHSLFESTPQLNLAFALFHQDPHEGNCLLLIHPGEIFSTHQNFSNN